MSVFISQKLQHGNSPPSAPLLIFFALLTPFVPATFSPYSPFASEHTLHPLYSYLPSLQLFSLPVLQNPNPSFASIHLFTEHPSRKSLVPSWCSCSLQDFQAQKCDFQKGKHLLQPHAGTESIMVHFNHRFSPFLPIFREFVQAALLWHKVTTEIFFFFFQKLENSTKKMRRWSET